MRLLNYVHMCLTESERNYFLKNNLIISLHSILNILLFIKFAVYPSLIRY